MDWREMNTVALAAAALFTLSAALAQTPDPTLPEDANDEQSMVPENANDGEELTPTEEPTSTTAQTPAPRVTPTPAAEPIAQPEGPPPSARTLPTNVLILAGNAPEVLMRCVGAVG